MATWHAMLIFLFSQLGILTEQETVQGIMLLHFGFKSSLQLDVDGKNKTPVKRWRVFLSSFLFIIVGYIFLVNLIFIIAKADDVLSLFFDMVALVSLVALIEHRTPDMYSSTI